MRVFWYVFLGLIILVMFDKLLVMYGFDEDMFIFLGLKSEKLKDKEDILVVEKESEKV